MMQHITSYKFIPLSDLPILCDHYHRLCALLSLKGTILLSEEGINLSLAGEKNNIDLFKTKHLQDPRFNDMVFRHSKTISEPFKRLKVKIKKEIITLRNPSADPLKQRAKSLAPQILKQWLDQEKDFLLLDTRNDYEIKFGTFKNALNLNLDHFCEFPTTLERIPRHKPIVMFCTGGVRCEKAGVYLLNEGYNEVYQLQGGILNYFEQVGSEHYQGDCYVFDDRIAVNSDLEPSGTVQCQRYQDHLPNTQQP